MNILMIDDEANFLNLLRRPLAKHGYSITEAHNGKQGWETFLHHPDMFDVIVTDIDMPILDGVELLKRLREQEYDIPVIIMTAHEDIQFAIEVLRLGAFDFLLKPFTAKKLIAILNKLEAIQAEKKKPLEDVSFFSEHINISIRSQIKFIPSVVSFLQNRVSLFCKLHKIDVRNIGLCLHEALLNAIIHGNLEISSEIKDQSSEAFETLLHQQEALPELADKKVHIRCQITTEYLKFEIEDQGQGFDARQLKPSHPMSILPTGRGMLIITSLMDEVFWNESRNCITMIKTLRKL